MEKGNSAKFVKIVILVAFLLGLYTYITFYLTKTHYEGKGNNSGIEEQAPKQEEKIEDITNQETVQTLYNDIHNYEFFEGSIASYSLYGKYNDHEAYYLINSILRVSDMDYDKLLSVAYNLALKKYEKQLEVKTVKKEESAQNKELLDVKETSISEELVKKTFKELFGNNKEYIAKTVIDNISESNADAYYDSSIYYKDGKYITYELRGLGGDINPVKEVIYKAIRYNNKIEILTAVCYREYDGKLYKEGVEKNLVTEIGETKEEEYETKIETYVKANPSKFHNYKYTFNREKDGSYSFYSVEKVQ